MVAFIDAHRETYGVEPLGGQLKTGNLWTAKPAIASSADPGLSEFYFVTASVRKSVCTFVRQLRGPHLRTWA